MINHHAFWNRWQTHVVSALRRTSRTGQEDWAYLSNEVRAEAILDEEGRIFNGTEPYEFCVLQSWLGTFILRSGSCLYGFNPLRNYRLCNRFKVRGNSSFYVKCDYASLVVCPQVEVVPIGFQEALSFLQEEDREKHNRIYMRIAWQDGDWKYDLYTPCKYLNFPNPSEIGRRYIQPQAGYVLYFDENRFYISYVAADLTDGMTRRVEFRVRDLCSYLSLKKRRSILRRLVSLADNLILRHFMLTEEFHKIVRVEGQCSLYMQQGRP
jgi:hypothetical protein